MSLTVQISYKDSVRNPKCFKAPTSSLAFRLTWQVRLWLVIQNWKMGLSQSSSRKWSMRFHPSVMPCRIIARERIPSIATLQVCCLSVLHSSLPQTVRIIVVSSSVPIRIASASSNSITIQVNSELEEVKWRSRLKNTNSSSLAQVSKQVTL